LQEPEDQVDRLKMTTVQPAAAAAAAAAAEEEFEAR
jgi:hypothetical protein